MSDRRRTFDDRVYGHFITFSCDRLLLLDEDQPKRILLGRLNEQLNLQAAACVGFVVMPDHVHAIVRFYAPGKLSCFMHGLKRRPSAVGWAVPTTSANALISNSQSPIEVVGKAHPTQLWQTQIQPSNGT